MRILFTKSNTPGSRWIRAITGEPVSHCAILWGATVIHSSYWGIEKLTYSDFISHNDIVEEVQMDIPGYLISEAWRKYKDKPYDYGALLYLGVRYLLVSLGFKVSNRNLWQDSGCYLCSEFISATILDEPDSIITPHQLFLKLSGDK